MANDTVFGLAAYAFTRDVGRAFRVMGALEYGQVGINAGVITLRGRAVRRHQESGHGPRRLQVRRRRLRQRQVRLHRPTRFAGLTSRAKPERAGPFRSSAPPAMSHAAVDMF